MTIKHKITAQIKQPEGKNFWPYSDSYVPKLKEIKDELIPQKERHHRQNQIGVMNMGQLSNRKGEIQTFDKQYRDKVKEAAELLKLRKATEDKEWTQKIITTMKGYRHNRLPGNFSSKHSQGLTSPSEMNSRRGLTDKQSVRGSKQANGDMMITEDGRTPSKKSKRIFIDAANSMTKKPAGNGEIYDSTGKLIFPLIKGYDDYDRVLKEVLGDDSKKVIGLISDIKPPSAGGFTGKGIFRTLAEEDFSKAVSTPQADDNISLQSKISVPVSVSPFKRSIDNDHIDKYCRPQYLNICDQDDLGFAYNLVGVFGTPDDEQGGTFAYACLVSVCPPAEPYKPKGANSMLGAFLFSEIDWKQTTPH